MPRITRSRSHKRQRELNNAGGSHNSTFQRIKYGLWTIVVVAILSEIFNAVFRPNNTNLLLSNSILVATTTTTIQSNTTTVNTPQLSTATTTTTTTTTTKSTPPKNLSKVDLEFPLPRIAYLALTDLHPHTTAWDECIFPGTDLFVPAESPYYVVLEEQFRTTYESLMATNATFRNYAHRIQPIYTSCQEHHAAVLTCCQQDQALTYFFQHYYYNNGIPKYDWIVYQADDDEYFRHGALQEFLRYLPVHSEPLIVTADPPPGHKLGRTGHYTKKSQDILPYTCPNEDNANWTYPWGNPVIYNQRSFELLLPALERNAITQQCQEFQLHAHSANVGNAILHWMYSIPAIWMRQPSHIGVGYRSDYLSMDHMGVSKYGPRNDMYFVHHKFEHDHPYPHNHTHRPTYYFSSNATGFRHTMMYQQHGDPSTWQETWHVFPTVDCQPAEL